MKQDDINRVIKNVCTFGWVYIDDKQQAESLKEEAAKQGRVFSVQDNPDPHENDYVLVYMK